MTQNNAGRGRGKLSLDACMELLASRQRRVIIQYFLDSETDNASVDEIISAIAMDEERVTGERPGHDSLAATLYHVHLPKFADVGILEYDMRHLDIQYHGDPRVEELYERINDLE